MSAKQPLHQALVAHNIRLSPAPRRTGTHPRPAARANNRTGGIWFCVLLFSLCLEGLGRKFLPFIPALLFYFAKDAVLIVGLGLIGIHGDIKKFAFGEFGRWSQAFPVAIIWTVTECLNPFQNNLGLAALGLRSYWLWWLAPLLIASALRTDANRQLALRAMAVLTIFVAALAAYQFARPATDAVNTYALYEDREVNTVDIVVSTGRARVSSTFSYISGFTIYCQVAALLMLALGLGSHKGRGRTLYLLATMACFAALPMGGSRGPMVMLGGCLALVAWGAGLLRTKTGRRVVLAATVALAVTPLVSDVAVQGVFDRFSGGRAGETESRALEYLQFLPPVAFLTFNYPMLGIGTGMEQNAAYALGLRTGGYSAEAEYGKILVELGPIGWLLLWAVRVGVVVALVRLGRRFDKAGQGAIKGACWGLGVMILTGKVYFDHVSQALLFVALGIILSLAVQLPNNVQSTSPSRRKWR